MLHRSQIIVISALFCLGTLGRRLPADTTTSLGDHGGEGSTPFTGLAQAPEANLFTGALTTSVPIDVPPGRKNLTPKLVLQYSSAGGSSPYGFGWDLPLGKIQRSTKWGIPAMADPTHGVCTGAGSDSFVLTLPGGTVDLVPDPSADNPAAGYAMYRPKIDEAYLEARAYKSANYWVVYDRSGMQYVFGDRASARTGNDSSRFGPSYDPQQWLCRYTSVWALAHMQDPSGNSIDLSYAAINNVLYPTAVDYGGNAQAGLGHFYHVKFSYAGRPDAIESDLGGFTATLIYRLSYLRVTTDVPSSIFRAYSLSYLTGADGQSVLSAVTRTGYPTQYFSYADPARAPVSSSYLPPSGITFLRKSDASREVWNTILDMNGDGIPDLVAYGASNWWVYLGQTGQNGGPGGFSRTATTWPIPSAIRGSAIRDVNVDTGACSHGTECVDRDTFDINGDGLPDYVDATTTPWTVYSGTGSGFSSTPMPWTAPSADTGFAFRPIRKEHYIDFGDGGGELQTEQDLVDMNGDGLPDMVLAGTASWTIYLNTGAGFDVNHPLVWFAPLAYTRDESTASTHHDLIDFNGDGLPDLVTAGDEQDPECMSDLYSSCLYVYMNGNFTTYVQGFRNIPVKVRIPNTAFGKIRRTDGGWNTIQDMLDVNGDGLPDYVEVHPDEGWSWWVLLNQGGKLEPFTCDPNTYACQLRPWPGAGGPIRQTDSNHETTVDVFDFDGDGLLDHVFARGSTWTVERNGNTPKPNLLTSMQSVGGTTRIFYKASTAFDNTGGDGITDLPFVTWVASGIHSTDGLCAPAADGDVLDTLLRLYVPASNTCIMQGNELAHSFTYRDGRFDPATREFRGFRTVYRTNPDLHIGVTTFGQDASTKGKVLATETYTGAVDRAHLVRAVEDLWRTDPIGTNRTRLWLGASTTYLYDLDLSRTDNRTTANDPPDAFGNIHHTVRYGSGGGELHTYTDFGTPNGAPVYDRPSHTYSVYTWRDVATAQRFDEQWFFYDAPDGIPWGRVTKGNVTAVESWVDDWSTTGAMACTADGSKHCARTSMRYDAYANIVQVTDALGRSTTTTYDDGNHKYLYPYQVTNALQQTTTTQTDYRWGKPLAITGSNGNAEVTQYGYDAAGRLTCIARPYDSTPGVLPPATCSVKYTYSYAAEPGQLSAITLKHKDPNQTATYSPYQESGYVASAQYFDALGRARFATGFQVVNGADQAVVSERVTYDAAGRVSERYDPYPVAPTTDPLATTPNNGSTIYEYGLNGSGLSDPFERVHVMTQPDGTTQTTMYNGFVTTSYDEENHKSVAMADWLGRVRRKESYTGTSATLYALYAWVDYAYDGDGRVLRSLQNGNANTGVAITYDSLGRKTEMRDPDSGTWRYKYDAVGNLLYQDDPATLQHVQFCYDAANRVTKKLYFADDNFHNVNCASDTAAVTYTYDATSDGLYAKGRLGMVSDASGSTSFTYDARGRSTSVTKFISANGVSKNAAIAFAYDASDADRIRTTIYPDGERVTTTYDRSGQPFALAGAVSYITSAQYDVFGRPTTVVHANGNGSVRDTREYEGLPGAPSFQHGHRLKRLATQGPGGIYLDLNYTQYTARGLLQFITDNGPKGAGSLLDNTVNLAYDHVGRLTSVWGTNYRFGPGAYAFDALGNMTLKEGTQYTYGEPAKPHQVTQIGATAMVHDANGNLSQGRTGQSYVFDKDDHVQQLTWNGNTVQFAYDYRGRRVAKIAGSSVTRYYSGLIEGTDGWLTKYYYLGSVRVASQRVPGFQLAGAPSRPSVALAQASALHPALVLVLREDVQRGITLSVVVLGSALLFAPWRRKRVAGIALRHGHVVGVLLAFAMSSSPLPLVVKAAGAATPTATRTKTRTPTQTVTPMSTPTPTRMPPLVATSTRTGTPTRPSTFTPTRTASRTPTAPGGFAGVVHYHLDHLGSVQVITKADGTVSEYIRYGIYGEIRGHYNADGTRQAIDTCADDLYCREFTTYDTEPISGLHYAGARFYDPSLGLFLTHDPARQFANPYSYLGGDPINRTDPNGECDLFCIAVIALAATFIASAVDAGVRSGDVGAAFKAGAVSMTATAAGPLSPGLQLLDPHDFGGFDAADWAIAQIPVAGSAYGAYRAFDNGDYASGTVSVMGTVYQAFGVYQNGYWSTPGQAATTVGEAVTAPFIGEDFGAAWRRAFADTFSGNWKAGPTGGYMPASWADTLLTVPYPENARANGMHAWHAGSNALFARTLGIAGAPLTFAAGLFHESPLDSVSFQAEQHWQGSVNHFLDSSTDIAANVFGMAVGYSKLGGARGPLSARAAEWGNYIPGPGEPDPAFGGGGPYKARPSDAWGQYP